MEESNKKNIIFQELYEMYVKIKTEIKCQHEKSDRNKLSLFESILKFIEDKLNTENRESVDRMKLTTMKAILFYEQAKILITTQDLNVTLCLQLLRDALSFIEEYKLNGNVTYLYYRILNLLCYTLSKLNQYDEALKLLEQGEIFYRDLNNKQDILVYNSDDFFQNVHVLKCNEIKFEKLITNNLQIQAWIYNKMTQSKKFLKYHHIVLNRQLETQDGSALLWFYKCARLGVYFFSNQNFVAGKHHLAAAFTVLREYELELLKHRFEPHYLNEWRNLKRYYADLGKYWTKYGLFLFNASRHLAKCIVNSEITINDILVGSFQDPLTNDPSREWFAIKKNSMLFPEPKSNLETDTLITNKSPKNLEEELNEQNQEDLATNIEDTVEKPVELSVESNLVNNIQEEITKLNKEVDGDDVSEEINEVTKMLIDALDDRQKEVETNQNFIIENDVSGDYTGDQKTTENVLNSDYDHKSDSKINQNIDDQTKTQSETNATSVQKDSDLTNKETENCSQSSTASNIQDTYSNREDDIEYEFKFPSLDLSYFTKITTSLIDSTESAREFFSAIKEWLKYSKSYYTIQEHPNEYIQIILDLNDLYRYLSQYETDLEKQYDIQKKRVGLLEALTSLLKDLRPQEYLFISIELLQELMQCQIELLMLNIRRLTSMQSSGDLLLKDICQEHNDATRKIEALTEIQRRLGRRDTKLSLIDLQLFG